MSEQNNLGQNEEEMEEEILINQEDGEEGGEFQDVYAFDMEINDDAYLIIIGKTDENKIFLRLMDKVDQSKPFFHGEFSLEDLRIINPIFKGIDTEDIAFQYLASNLNEAEKNIKIIDDEKIQFNLIIADEEDKFEFNFILIKTIDDGTGENENEAENMENEMEEGVEEMINEVNEINDMNEINEVNENNDNKDNISDNKKSKEKIIMGNDNQINNNINPKDMIETVKGEEILTNNPPNENADKGMNLMKDELLNIINSLKDDFNNQIMKQNKAFDNMKEDLIKQSDSKINQMKEELNKKDQEIIELKNTIDDLKQKLNGYESKLKDVNLKFDNINKDNNKSLKNSSKINEQNNNNIDSDKIMNEVQENLRGFDNKITEVKNIFEKDKKENDNIIKNLTEKMNNLDKNMQKNKSKDNDNMKILSIEKGLKALDNKINTYELDQLIENIAILMEKQNDNKIYGIINKIETQINEIKQKLNRRDSFDSKNKNKYDPDLINKINNHENIITKLQNKINKFHDEKQIDNSSKNKIQDIAKQANDLKTKMDSLIAITKKLENDNKELNNKTNNLTNKFSQISIPPYNPQRQEQSQSAQFQTKKLSNPKPKYYRTIENQNYNPDNQISYYNRTNPNMAPNLNVSKDSINSKIVNFSDINFLQKRIMQINPKIKEVYFSLVYRATEDGDKAANFHQKCDKIGPNIVLIKTRKGCIFGGFTFRNWEHLARDMDVNRPNLGSASRDTNAFGFNVNKQKIYNNEKPNEFAIWCNKNFGPTFKNNLFQIFDHSLKKGGYCNLRKNSNFGGQMFDYEISGGEPKFKIEELEVFEVKLL